MKSTLKLDWCAHEAALFAVEHWHYSRSLPTPPLVKVGVWEDGKFIGCVIFGRGASATIGKPYGLEVTEIAELTRVALSKHSAPVSRIVAIAIKMLRKQSPGLRLLISFADPVQKHHGGIYQAMGWIYSGLSAESFYLTDKAGRKWHSRMVSKTGTKVVYGQLKRVPKLSEGTVTKTPGKHRYLLPLDAEMRERCEALAKEYPKREVCAASIDGDAPEDHSGEAGSNPSAALLALQAASSKKATHGKTDKA